MLLPYFLDRLLIGNEACQNAPSAFCVVAGDLDIAKRKRRRHGSKTFITLCQCDMPTPLARGVERDNIAGSAYFIVVHGVSSFCMKLQTLAKRCRCLHLRFDCGLVYAFGGGLCCH
jgi:hypothetical protein